MSEDVRAWLVERDHDDKGLVRYVYATEDGARRLVRERARATLGRIDVTAADDVDPAKLEPVDDPETRDRYAAEVERMRERHDPGDPV